MKLYFSPGACSLAPHIILRESASAFTLEQVDIATHLTGEGRDYFQINPKGQVPALLLEDGSLLSEGPVIAQYIAERAANHALMPVAGSLARYRVLEWQNYITAELHKSFSPLFNPEFEPAAKSLHTQLLRKKYTWLESQLNDSGYLTGADFTVADAYLFAVTGWAKYLNLDLSDLPKLQGFLARVAARPAVYQAMQAEGLLK